MLSPRTTLFLLSSLTVTCIILAFVFISSAEKKFGTVKNSLKLVKTPKSNDDLLGYAETNISSPRVACRANYDFSLLPELSPLSSTPLPSNASSQVTATLSANLLLTNAGELEYYLNELRVWKSGEPRAHIGSVETNVLKEFVAKRPSETWEYIGETSNGLRLHVAPLAITGDRGKKIVWTFLSGWDPLTLCLSVSLCELPMQVPLKEKASMIMISKDRSKRLVLSTNSDLLILSRAPTERGSSTLKTEVKESLISSFCI